MSLLAAGTLALGIAVFGADVADTSSAVAGWTGTSLLGGVLGWLLLKHLPAKDAQTKELADAHASAQEKLLDRHDTQIKRAQEVFQAAIESVVAHCREELTEIASSIKKS